MAKAATPKPATPKPATPVDFAQVEPDELFPTNNIRFVMWETAKLTERVDGLTKAVDKLGPAFEKALDKHAADIKERISDVKADGKETSKKLGEVKESIDSFKGAMKVFGGIYALALVLVAAFLAWFLRPVSPAPAPVSPSTVVPSQQGSGPQANAAASALNSN